VNVSGPLWLLRGADEVPAGDGWLSVREREVQAALVRERRRADWRLGRWAAKCAVAALLGRDPDEVEVLAAADGAPAAHLGDAPAPVSLSLSHRGGLALAVAGPTEPVLGCDLEVLEPRSGAFVREWLSPRERALVEAARDPDEAMLLANLAWTGKEAAAKVRREGLRLDVRRAVVVPLAAVAGGWRALAVRAPGGPPVRGWWRTQAGFVMTVAAAGALPAPVPAALRPPSSRPCASGLPASRAARAPRRAAAR
jgi:4'-phosphopantetheinyl transferase